LDDCVHCLETNDPESVALEVSADALLSFGLNSAYRNPAALPRMLARQRPILHVFESTSDPSFEVLGGMPHLSSQNNRFALTAALETAIQADWIMPNESLRLLSPERHCWDVIASALVGFVCLAGSGGAVFDRAGSTQIGSNQIGSEQGSSPAAAGLARQTVSGTTAKV
jgi:hypothetical protein